ncbi:hypothetical protein D2M30_0780 [Bacillus amyloliquefaciens]|nr:hypothetical protein D2M30_0780 [Bacillus amyloliquefaciens]
MDGFGRFAGIALDGLEQEHIAQAVCSGRHLFMTKKPV